MNTLLLITVRKLRGLSATIRSILSGAALGTSGAVAAVCLKMPTVLYLPVMGIILPALMIQIAFHTKNIKSRLLNLITLYLISALIAGTIQMIFCHTPLNSDASFIHTLNRSRGISWFHIITGTMIAGIGLVILYLRHFHSQIPENCKVVLIIHGQEIEATALIDTGNGLYEPVSQQPVSVIHYEYFKKYFIQQDIQTVRMIPMWTVGGENRMLTAVRIDGMDVYTLENVCHFKDVYVAFNTHRFGENEVLLHPKMWRI